jgi:uncharacterized protein (TIGR02996 family)
MGERDALLSAILANPDDDVSRLVYADWLEETGRPVAVARARFIRLQIEQARATPDETFPHAAAALTRAIDALAAQWARAWLAERSPRVARAVWNPRAGAAAFRRGFVDGVKLDVDVFLWSAAGLFAAAPITALHLHGGSRGVAAVLAGPDVRRLRSVRLSGRWDGDGLARSLGPAADLGAVRDLDLSGCELTDGGALTTRRVRANHLTGFGIDSLASAPALAALTHLDVAGNPGARRWSGARVARHGKQLLC